MTDPKCAIDDALAAFEARDHARGRSILTGVIAEAADKPELQQTKFKALSKLANHQSFMGDFEEAESNFLSAYAIAESPSSPLEGLALAEFYKDFGFLFDQQSKEIEAISHYEKAKVHYNQAIASSPDLAKTKGHYEFLVCYAKAAERRGHYEVAAAVYHDALPIMESVIGVANGSCNLVRNGLARVLEKLGQTEAAGLLRQEERHLAGFKQTPMLSTVLDSVAALQSMGFISQLAIDELPKVAKETSKLGVHPDEIFSVLVEYYFDGQNGEDRAEADSFIAHDYKYRKETDDLPAELCKLVGLPLLTQVSYKKRADSAGHQRMCLGLRRDDGVGICVSDLSMEAIVDVFNAVLKDRGDKRRFFQLFTEQTLVAYYLLTIEEAQELTNVRAMAFDDMHRSLNASSAHFEKFTTWPGEVKPKHLKRFKCAGGKETKGNYTANTKDGTTTIYDISQMPAKKLFDIDFDLIFDFGHSAGGDWYFIGRSKRPGFVGFNFLLIKDGQNPDNGLWIKDSDSFRISSNFIGHHIGEILFLFEQGSHKNPKVFADSSLISVEGLDAPSKETFKLDIKGSIVTTNAGTNYLMWADHFYRREKNNWEPCPEWHLPKISEHMVAHGAEGVIFLSKGMPYLATPGNAPKKLMDETFMHIKAGPRQSALLYRPQSWGGGLRHLLLFSDTGKEIDFDDVIFGSPDSEINFVGYLPDTDKMVATTWDVILSFSADQLV